MFSFKLSHQTGVQVKMIDDHQGLLLQADIEGGFRIQSFPNNNTPTAQQIQTQTQSFPNNTLSANQVPAQTQIQNTKLPK